MKKKNIDLYYYSGTGNTLLVIQEMVKVLEENAITVALHRIEKTNPASIRTDRTIGLAFPVAFQSTFPFLWDFFRALPNTNGTEVFMIDTMMAFSGAIVGPLKKTLKQKGYTCIGAKEIIMPSNWFPKKINKDKNELKIKKGLQQTRKYARDLVNKKTAWRRIPGLSDLLYRLCCNDFMMKNVNTASGKKITANSDKCTGCGLCSRLCPVGNISMSATNKFPEWSNQCEICMRCLCFCPAGAVSVSNKKFEPYRAIKAAELIKINRDKANEVA
ncbi:MAG: 4Fe-4S ferredoxin [bacterium]|nr:4Fe-4S ferredoxin [bacterium]